MKKTTTLLCAAAAILMLAQCSKKTSGGHTKAPAKTPVEQVADAKSKYTHDQIESGKAIFTTKCADCHELKQPQEFTVKQWNRILPDMVHKSKLTDQEAGMLNAWIIINAKASS